MSNTEKLLDILGNKLSPIMPYMQDPEVQEIMIVKENSVFVEKNGKLEEVPVKISSTTIRGAIILLGKLNQKDIRENTPDMIVNSRIDGFRIAAAIEPVGVHGCFIQIRKHNPRILTLSDYVGSRQITQRGADILHGLIKEHKNILVAGGTSSGKTTLLNCLIALYEPHEVVRSVEDTQEIQVSNKNWIALEANEQHGITQRSLVKLCLRLRPDRLILGELRSGEAYDLMQMANTGHAGIIGTIHASSADRTLIRFEDLVLESGATFTPLGLKRSIAAAINVVIYAARTKEGFRRIEEIISIDGVDETTMQYKTTKLYSHEEIENEN